MDEPINRAWLRKGFAGYGRLEAPLWFLGMEERCEDHDDAARRLELLPTFGPTMGLREAHSLYGFEELPTKVPVWRSARATASEYGSDAALVGEPQGDVFLAELMPLPRPSNDDDDWPPAYRALFPNYLEYEADLLDERATLFAGLILLHRPRVVVVHGVRYHADVEAALLALDEKPRRQRCNLGGKTADVLSFAASQVVFVHNLGGAAAWSSESRLGLARLAAGLARGDGAKELEVRETPIEWLLAGMFHHRAGNVIPRRLAEELPGYAHHASRTEVDELVRRPGFREWATRPSALQEGLSPIDACIARDASDVRKEARCRSLRKRYGNSTVSGVEAAHERIQTWASRGLPVELTNL